MSESYIQSHSTIEPNIEEGRLAALYRYALLDTPREDTFDDLVAMGARHFGVPYAVISLIDRDRIWFKSRFGIDDPQVVRTPGLCATAIQHESIYHLQNASLDPIARTHPLVEPDDGIRFYAGAPLRSEDGYNIGSICVMGHEPRDLTENDRRFLEALARLTINEIERRYAQEQLHLLNQGLDARVRQRTLELDSLITDLKHEGEEKTKANLALQQSEDRQRQIAELSSDFCFEVEIEPGQPARLLWTTGPVSAITGWSTEELDLANWSQYVHPEDRVRLPGIFESATTSGRAEFEYRFHCKDGSYRWVRLNLDASAGRANMRSIRFLVAVKDLHSLRSAEDLAEARSRDLEQSRLQLHEARRLAWLGTVASGMAHQINNPVGSMLAASEFALVNEGAPDERSTWKRALADIRDEAKRCGKIVRSILQFARQESTTKRRTDLRDVIETATRLAGSYADEHHVKLEVAVESRDTLPVAISRVEVEEVFVNLIRNAIEAQPKSPVQVDLARSGGDAIVRVIDDGTGIPMELTQRVFDPFFTTRLEQGGTGLGLSVAQGIVADHGGSIEVSSQSGLGTTVTVRLPLDSV